MFTVRPEGLEAAREACALTVIGVVVEEGIWMENGKRGEAGGSEGVRAQDWGGGLNSRQIF